MWRDMATCAIWLPRPGCDCMPLPRRRVGLNYLHGNLQKSIKSEVQGKNVTLWDQFFNSYYNPYTDRALDDCTKKPIGPTTREGSFGPQSCFPGTFRIRSSANSLGECQGCTAGHHCDWQSWKDGLSSPGLIVMAYVIMAYTVTSYSWPT